MRVPSCAEHSPLLRHGYRFDQPSHLLNSRALECILTACHSLLDCIAKGGLPRDASHGTGEASDRCRSLPDRAALRNVLRLRWYLGQPAGELATAFN